MPLIYQTGDIFDSTAQIIVNAVNCEGYMGKGLALAFKQRYPDMFRVYQQECKTGKLRIGRPTLYKESTPWILNFPTKDHWRPPSKMEYIEKGLAYFVAHYKEVGITSIAFPKLGAQNGKLSWDDVGPVMAEYLGPLDIDVYIYITDDDREYQHSEQQVSEARVDVLFPFLEKHIA
ncbi:MAG TPA: macro domain-containing protein [Ktedonobacteraceae bacterium]|nr:macro domain-containing protein [Ktedonobacteraceae bacterium]